MIGSMRQWHPVFVRLLRPVVEKYYEVRTTVPVGDAPREADIVLLRRTSRTAPPFQGLWRHLTAWNVLEYKGPSVSPRRGDVDRLVELGLGIHRRLGEDHAQVRALRVSPEAVSFWYLANHFGRRFLRDAEESLGRLEALGPGLWRGQVLRRLVFLVSSGDLPVEPDSLPLHVAGFEAPEKELEAARLVTEQSEFQAHFGGWMTLLHPAAWREAQAMKPVKWHGLNVDLTPVVETLGWDGIIDILGGSKEFIRHVGMKSFLASLAPKDRRELKRLLLEEEGK
jgi:hypothetical protein